MKFTQRQLDDIECCLYFLPGNLKKFEVTDQDKREFFDMSEKGIRPSRISPHGQINNGLDMILQGKRWRGIHCDSSKTHRAMWEEGILEGTMPYSTILQDENGLIPIYVKDYMKKSLFGGIDAEKIDTLYQKLKNA